MTACRQNRDLETPSATQPSSYHPPLEHQPPKLNFSLRYIEGLSCYTIAFIITYTILTVELTTTTAAPARTARTFEPDLTKTTWLFRNINRRIDNLSVDGKTGDLYVLSGDDVLNYHNDLVLKQTIMGNRSTSSFDQDRMISISFTIINFNGLSLLLSCSAVATVAPKHITCRLYRTDQPRGKSIGWSYKGQNGENIKLDIGTDFNEQMRILSSDPSERDMIFAMSRPTSPTTGPLNIINSTAKVDPNQSLMMPTLARVNLITRNFSSLQIHSVLPYKSRVDHSNDYIYIFKHGNHTHFVLNDISKTQSSVRLARICSDDTNLFSYTEISMTCEGKTNALAKTAVLTDGGDGDNHLYVVFEDRNQTSMVSSYICRYSLNLINDKIDAAASHCHKASHLTKTLAKFDSEWNSQDCQLNSVSNDWCTTKMNSYIDGTADFFSISEDKFVEIKGLSSVNFMTVLGQGDKTVYLIGTKTGRYSKFHPGQDDILYTVDLFSKKIKYSLVPEKSTISIDTLDPSREARYVVSSGDVIAATSANELHRLPMDSCHFYRTCSVCIQVKEPDLCVWCDSSCSRDSECDNATQTFRSTCPPQIERFEPTSGPLTGTKTLAIFGQSFGSRRANVRVTLDDEECAVLTKYPEENKIICEVLPVDKPKNATLFVTVFDNSGPYDINGTSSLGSSPFEYVEVIMYGIHPSEGSLGGGNVTVFGKNLNAGSSRQIRLGDVECHIISLSPDKLQCLTEMIQAQQDNYTKNQVTPSMRVDGNEQKFSYVNVIEGYELSKTYRFIEDTVMTTEALADSSNSYYTSSLILILIVITIVTWIYLKRCEGMSMIKSKLPSAFTQRSAELDNSKVMFRNPNSHTFNKMDPAARQSDSLNGLIKLNGSVMSSDYFSKPEQLEQDKPLMQNFLDEEMLALLASEKILIDRSRLTLGHVLGSGQFGRVYKGFLEVDDTGEHAAVAVKTLHSRCHWEDGTDNQAFLEEGLMMKDFKHDNVLALIGVAFDSNGLPMVITPFMLYGDLRSYISDEASSPTVKELIEFGTQVAQGMAYLSNQKFVHRDLAARNCMLDENLIVKVADFGLSRDIYERDYYSSDNKTVKLPVKWMAIESLEKSVYTTKSDVWSYGVLLWELMTRGVVPYPDVDNFDLYKYLKGGRRMLRPKYCPVILYNLMLSCWSESPALRPTFEELMVLVSDVITKLKEVKDESGQQKVDKDETYCDVIR